MNILKVKVGFENCLENGKRLLDDGRFLQESLRVYSAIPLLVMSHEEFGKCNFLRHKIVTGEEVTDAEWKKLVAGGSHIKKLTMSSETAKKLLADVSDKEYRAATEWAHKNKLPWFGETKKETIEMVTNSPNSLYNALKKKCLYVDIKNEDWKNPATTYSAEKLYYACTILYWSGYEVFLWHKLFWNNFEEGEKLDEDPEKIEKLLEKDPIMFELQDIRGIQQSEFWANAVNETKDILHELDNS